MEVTNVDVTNVNVTNMDVTNMDVTNKPHWHCAANDLSVLTNFTIHHKKSNHRLFLLISSLTSRKLVDVVLKPFPRAYL